MRADIEKQNEFLGNLQIGLSSSSAALDDQGFIVVEGRRLPPLRSLSYRVFNYDWHHGGRWYGPWWQNLPSRLRSSILIDGEATIEEDIFCCHPRLLLAATGAVTEDSDFYSQFDQPRDEVKLSFNTMLNASSKLEALGAIENDLKARYGKEARRRGAALMRILEDGAEQLAPFWNRSVGLQLQNIDAQICTWILGRLRRAGIPCLSIHDSFIVPTIFRDTLLEVMREGFDRALKCLLSNGLTERSRKIF